MNQINDSHTINIPAFISELKEIDENGAIFTFNEDSLIEEAKIKFDEYNEKNEQPIISDKRSKKATRLGIGNIEIIDISFNTDKALLLKVSSFKTHLVDGYYQRLKDDDQTKDEYQFKINDRICSDTYFFVLYPVVKRNTDNNKCQEYWHVFLYVDPSKEEADMKMIARYIMSKILKRPIKHIKANKFIEELKKQKLIQSVEISLFSYSDNDDEDRPGYLKEYPIVCKIKKHKTITLAGMTPEDAVAAYEDTSFKENYNRRQLKFINENQQVYQATQEFHKRMKESFEDSFNYSVSVTIGEVNSGEIFKTDFIKDKIEGLLTRYTIK